MRAIRIFGRNIRDAFKSVFRNFSLSLASIACIIITLCVVSIAIILSYNVNNFTVRVEQDMTIVVFLNRDIEDERIKEIEDEIKVLNNVESVTFNDKMQIAEEMKESSEDLAGFLEQYEDRDSNPLSDAFHVKVTDVLTIEDVALEIEKIDGVMSVKYGEGMIEPLISTFDFVKNISYGVVIALVLVTAFLISNTIKITIFSRKREIEIMRSSLLKLCQYCHQLVVTIFKRNQFYSTGFYG